MAYSSNLVMFNEFQEFIDEDQKTREVSFYWNHVIIPSWLMVFFVTDHQNMILLAIVVLNGAKESLIMNLISRNSIW